VKIPVRVICGRCGHVAVLSNLSGFSPRCERCGFASSSPEYRVAEWDAPPARQERKHRRSTGRCPALVAIGALVGFCKERRDFVRVDEDCESCGLRPSLKKHNFTP
jgi:uncharacterized protein (DUF983 family)